MQLEDHVSLRPAHPEIYKNMRDTGTPKIKYKVLLSAKEKLAQARSTAKEYTQPAGTYKSIEQRSVLLLKQNSKGAPSSIYDGGKFRKDSTLAEGRNNNTNQDCQCSLKILQYLLDKQDAEYVSTVGRRTLQLHLQWTRTGMSMINIT